jgi:hypothetical protein
VEGHFRWEVFFDSTDQEELVCSRVLDQLSMAYNKVGIKYVFTFVLHAFELHVDHVFKLIGLEMPQYVGPVLETSKKILTKFWQVFSDNRSSCACFIGAMVINLANKLFLVFIGR